MSISLDAREERLNTLTHGFGTLLAAIAGSWLIASTWPLGKLPLLSAMVFSASMLLLYLASTLYHHCREPIQKARWKVVDHCAIYVLIAGTYTPFTLIALGGSSKAAWLFPTIWALAIAGIIFKLFFTGRFKLVSTLIYLAMGWLVIVVYQPLSAAISTQCLTLVALGGACYTLGAAFYLAKRLPYSHAIWHVFVLLGTGSHFAAVVVLMGL